MIMYYYDGCDNSSLCSAQNAHIRSWPRAIYVEQLESENNLKKLEIWGRAQCEAARRRKSEWGDNLGGLNSAPSKAIALADAPCAVSSW